MSQDQSRGGIPYHVIYRATLESHKDGIVVTDISGFILDYNSAFLAIWGLTDDQMKSGDKSAGVDQALEQVKDPISFAEKVEFTRQFPDEKTSDLVDLRDGRIFQRISKPFQHESKTIGRIWYFTDVTDSVLASEKIKISNAILRSVVDNSQDGILVVDGNNQVALFNQLYLTLFNLTAEFLVNESPENVIEYSMGQIKNHEDIQPEIMSFLKSAGEDKSNVLHFLDGKIVERFTQSVRLSERGEGRILFYRDITEATNRMSELMDRTFKLDRFVYSASHDLKAPLNSLMGLLSLMRKEDMSQSAKDYLELMNKSLFKLDAYIRNLAEFSQNENLEIRIEEVDIASLIDEAINASSFLDGFEKIHFSKSITGNSKVLADPVRTKFIINNLVTNAVKYQDLKKSDRTVDINFERDDKKYSLHINDNGIGISEENREKIFEIFFRGTYQAFGSGLGLFITKNAIEKLGGAIQVVSTLGIGSKFSVTIPIGDFKKS